MSAQDENKVRLAEYQVNKLQELITDMHNCCQERIFLEAKMFDLPPSALKCLMLFDGHKYLTGMEVAGKLEVAKSRATVIIDSLAKKGLVQRAPDPSDARVKLVSLTLAGQKKVREIEDLVFHLHRQLLDNIEVSRRATVISSLETLRAAMEVVKGQFSG